MSFEIIDHVRSTWQHVTEGQSTTKEKIEVGVEATGLMIMCGALAELSAKLYEDTGFLRTATEGKEVLAKPPFPGIVDDLNQRQIIATHSAVSVETPIMGHEGLSKRWVMEQLNSQHIEVSTQYLREGDEGSPIFHSHPTLFENTTSGRLQAVKFFQQLKLREPGT